MADSSNTNPASSDLAGGGYAPTNPAGNTGLATPRLTGGGSGGLLDLSASDSTPRYRGGLAGSLDELDALTSRLGGMSDRLFGSLGYAAPTSGGLDPRLLGGGDSTSFQVPVEQYDEMGQPLHGRSHYNALSQLGSIWNSDAPISDKLRQTGRWSVYTVPDAQQRRAEFSGTSSAAGQRPDYALEFALGFPFTIPLGIGMLAGANDRQLAALDQASAGLYGASGALAAATASPKMMLAPNVGLMPSTGYAPPELPPFDGETTHGLLLTDEGDIVPLRSGNADPAYRNYKNASHVEGKAAIYIRNNKSSGGVLYMNNSNGICGICNNMTETLLPQDSQLVVVPPEDAVPNNPAAVATPLIYTGNATIPKRPR